MKMMCRRISYNKKQKIIFFASIKSLKKGVRSFGQKYGSPDPNLHQNVTDPQHWLCGPWQPLFDSASIHKRAEFRLRPIPIF
jgi:hypothetical protein